jgi:hypothetical protein
MEDQEQKVKSGEEVSEEDRYKYIGFDIYPGKVDRFWKSEEEERKYLEEMRRRKSSSSLLEREHSLMKIVLFSKVDRVILTITSILLLVSLFLPWFSVKGTGSLFFFGIGKLPATGALFGLFTGLMILIVLSSAAAGIISLLAIYRKEANQESYLENLKRKLKLNYLPLILWAVAIILSVIGMSTASPDSPLGASFNIIDFFTASSIGLWLNLPSLIINCVKISDL